MKRPWNRLRTCNRCGQRRCKAFMHSSSGRTVARRMLKRAKRNTRAQEAPQVPVFRNATLKHKRPNRWACVECPS